MEKENMFMNEGNTMPYAMRRQNELHGTSEQLQNCFYNQNWDNSMDQNDPFESALSSMVSSPAAAAAAGANGSVNENFVLRELIGRLGNISNSVEVSTQSYMGGNNSTNTSCYTTPLNSPPKLNLSMVDHQIRGNFPFSGNHLSAHPTFNPNERTARFSSFDGKGCGPGILGSGRDSLAGLNGHFVLNDSEFSYDKSLEVSQTQTNVQEHKDGSIQDGNSLAEKAEFGDSRENSSVSEQIPGGEIGVNCQNGVNSRKRKSISKGKGKDIGSDKDAHVAEADNNDSSAKRSKSEEDNRNREAGKSKAEQNGTENAAKDGNKKGNKGDKMVAEPPKDYIHVRARRGQATDAHSLAERVRREKISQRMKLLQDLVPGCNKVTGKAVMLDEIINYVQSLQRQVEFLSMKLSTINPRTDVNLEALLSKDMFQPHTSASALPFAFHSQQVANLHNGIPNGTNHLIAGNDRNLSMELSRVDGYDGEVAAQASNFWEDDLQSVVFGQNQTQNFHGVLPTSQMKLEL